MIDILLANPYQFFMPLAIVIAIFAWFKKIFSLSKIRAEQEKIEYQRYVVTVAADDHLMTVEMAKAIFLVVLAILFYLAITIMQPLIINLPVINILFLLGELIFLRLVYKGTQEIHRTIDAYHLYREEKRIDQEIDPEQDETAYLLNSPENARRLEKAMEEYNLIKD